MASRRSADDFAEQYAQFTQYPTNLTFTTTYQRDLEEYRDALISNHTLCIVDEEDLDVGFRDFRRPSNSALSRTFHENVNIDQLADGSIVAPAAVPSAVNAQDVAMFRRCLGDQSHFV